MAEGFDVIVIGGGPAGSTAATFLAMSGHRVLLVEREQFPVHKIGESLLPSTVHGICAMLGVSEQLARAGFVKKYGGTFRWGRDKEPWTIAFAMSRKLAGPGSFAYQVERMKFDTLLLENARVKGVDARERHAAIELLTDASGRTCGVSYREPDGHSASAFAKYTIDASGWSTTFNRRVGARVYSEFFKNVAVFGYYVNGKRLPAPRSGNIFSVAFERGWFWYIPLSDTLTSVGAVIGQEHAHLLHEGAESVLAALISECQPIRELLSDATRVTDGPYGQIRVRKDYSYCHSKFWSPGLALVGDAACFIDPVFSSGVHLATYSALLVARSINSCLSGALSEERAFNEFERRYLREYRYFYDFLVAFYNIDQDLDSYYWSARKVLNSDETGNEAFIQLIAGVGGSGESLFSSSEEYLRHRSNLGEQLFGQVRPTGDRGQATVMSGHDGARFWSELLTEVTQVQSQAVLREKRFQEAPLFPDGLVPSRDGLHWSEPTVEDCRP